MCWAWTLKHIIDEMFCVERGARSYGAQGYLMFCVEREDLEHMSIYICVEWESLEHMSYETFVLSMKLWNAWKYNLEVLGISPGALHVDVEHNLWNIGSLAIVSLGVSYKYILELELSEELWNNTKFVTPCF